MEKKIYTRNFEKIILFPSQRENVKFSRPQTREAGSVQTFCNNQRVQKQNLRRVLVSLKGHQPLCCNRARHCHQMSPQSTRTAPAYQAPPKITDVSAKKAGGTESTKISHACGPGPEGLWKKPRRGTDPVLMVQLVPATHDLEPCHSKLP